MKNKHRNRTTFRPGPDPRRHTFTQAERKRGGRTSWERYGYYATDPVIALRQPILRPEDIPW